MWCCGYWRTFCREHGCRADPISRIFLWWWRFSHLRSFDTNGKQHMARTRRILLYMLHERCLLLYFAKCKGCGKLSSMEVYGRKWGGTFAGIKSVWCDHHCRQSGMLYFCPYIRAVHEPGNHGSIGRSLWLHLYAQRCRYGNRRPVWGRTSGADCSQCRSI